LTKEKQLPFEKNRVKELRTKLQNLEGHSGSIGLHSGTSGSKKEAKK
jgi:hypothetical protein